MYHTSYGQAAWGYGDTEIGPGTFLTGGLAGVGALLGASAMTFYATPEEGYRYGWMRDADGEIPLWGDARVWIAGISFGAAAYGIAQENNMIAGTMSVLGASALMSLVSTEGIRWREDGKLFGIAVPQLPLPEGEAAAAVAAPAAVIEEVVAV